MKKKELKNLAKKIAEAERIIQRNEDSKQVAKAQKIILDLSGKVTNLEDIMTLDEFVQEILSQDPRPYRGRAPRRGHSFS